MSERKGLIRSRLIGAQNAKGSILVFLDAHCECTIGKYYLSQYELNIGSGFTHFPYADH